MHGNADEAESEFEKVNLGVDGAPPIAAAPFSEDDARDLQTKWAGSLDIPVELENSIGMKFRLIPPGAFKMGTPPSERQHFADALAAQGEIGKMWAKDVTSEPDLKSILTQPYYLGMFEVTNAQFRQFVDETGYSTLAETTGGGGLAERDGWNWHKSHIWRTPAQGWNVDDDDPVVQIAWPDAMAFCDWLSKKESRTYSLPTEAQWEFACRAGGQKTFGHADDAAVLQKIAWCYISSTQGLLPKVQRVGQKQANPFGLYDMLGNATEWCCDDWSPGVISDIPVVDPHIISDATTHPHRGGSYLRDELISRCSCRNGLHFRIFSCEQGFRVALNLKSNSEDQWGKADAETEQKETPSSTKETGEMPPARSVE